MGEHAPVPQEHPLPLRLARAVFALQQLREALPDQLSQGKVLAALHILASLPLTTEDTL